jgi:hypothetical protein
MRRSFGGPAAGVLMAALLAGCGPTAGADGAKTKNPSPEAKPFTPESGACHPVAEPAGYRTSYAPVGSRQHPDDQAAERTGSLRGELTHPSPRAHGCFNEDQYEILAPVACTKPHRFEYVGNWTAPDGKYETVDRDQNPVHGHCRDVVAAYTKGTSSAKLARGAGTTYRLPSPEAWERGDRGVRCFYWSDDRDLTRSLKAS